MVDIKHLSVTVSNPKKAAKILASITGGTPEEFRTKSMQGAWVCLWNVDEDRLIEFLPEKYLMYPTENGASFKDIGKPQGYNSTHIQLETNVMLEEIQRIAEEHNCHHYFRPKFGGPLYEVWIEEQFLVEFVSDEIRALV